MIPIKAYINKISDGRGYSANDIKYIGKAYNQVVTLKYNISSDMYITDFFIPEYIELKNDYIHYGFLIVSSENIHIIKTGEFIEYGI